MKKILAFAIVIIIGMGSIACGSKKYENPQDVYQAARDAVQDKEPKVLINLLSAKSIEALQKKRETLQENFAFIPSNPEARKAYETIASQMGISLEELGSFQLEHYVRYLMFTDGKDKGSNTNILPIGITSGCVIKDKKITAKDAEFITESGESIRFVNTPDGWKLCLI